MGYLLSFYWLPIIQARCGRKHQPHTLCGYIMDLGEVRQKDMWKGAHHQTLTLHFRQFTIWRITSSMFSIQCILTMSFFLMSSKLLPASAFWCLSCHFLYFIWRWSFLWSCLCDSPSSERWMLGVVELLLNYFITDRKSCCEVTLWCLLLNFLASFLSCFLSKPSCLPPKMKIRKNNHRIKLQLQKSQQW